MKRTSLSKSADVKTQNSGASSSKPGGKEIRLVTDFTHLNKYIKWPVHPFPATKDILAKLNSEDMVNAKMDAVQGYFQIPLAEQSAKLTTFLLPSGR